MENAHTSCEELFTVEVLRTVKPSAEKWAKRTHGALSADDLIQSAVMALWKARKKVPILDPIRLLTYRIRLDYRVWASGTNSMKHHPDAHEISKRQQYMSAVELPIDEGMGALSTGNPVKEWEMLLDIERALHTLTTEEQQVVRWKFWEDLSVREIAQRQGVSRMAVQRVIEVVLPLALKKLRIQLIAYE